MKRKILILGLICSVLFFAGCSDSEKENPNKGGVNKIENAEEINQKNGVDSAEENNEDIEEIVPDIKNYPEAFEGKFTGLDILFGETKDAVVEKLGEPEAKDFWQGAEIYLYGNLGVYLDPNNGEVIGLAGGDGYMTYGTVVGMALGDVKKVLGEPTYEGENVETDNWVLEYEAGDYLVLYTAQDKESKTDSVTVYRNNK